MKRADTIELVLKGKADNRVLSVTPDHSVYEAIEKMAVEREWAHCSCYPKTDSQASCQTVTMPAK